MTNKKERSLTPEQRLESFGIVMGLSGQERPLTPEERRRLIDAPFPVFHEYGGRRWGGICFEVFRHDRAPRADNPHELNYFDTSDVDF